VPATIPLLALAVPIAYANSPQQPCYRHEILSTDAVSSFQTAWTDLTPLLDHQDLILAVNRRHGSNLQRLPSAADGALLAQRTRGNILSATTAVESAQTLAAELSTSHKGFPKDPRRKHAKCSNFPILALHCVSDANATVDVDCTFEIWARQIITECGISTDATNSAFLQISRRTNSMTHLT